MNIDSILDQDNKTMDKNINKDRVVPLDKILSRLLKQIESRSKETRQGWVELMDWTEMASILSGLLPNNFLTQSSTNQTLIDPFLVVKQSFPATYSSKIDSIAKALNAMHNASGKRYSAEHLELVECLEDCKLITSQEAKNLSLEFLEPKI